MNPIALTTWALWALLVVACALSTWKWLRVAQREHYAPGRVTAMALIWLRARPLGLMLLAVAVALFAVSFVLPPAALLATVLAALLPWGLATFPKTTPLVVTGRVKRLIAVLVVLELALLAASTLLPVTGVAVLLLLPVLTDAALAVTKPIEATMAKRFVTDAQRTLRDVDPIVVAITGSYGKTSTKNYAKQLVAGAKQTLASPASFNNLLGLSKSVNDALRPGVEVFIAEMGTYGPGEIRRLCQLFQPKIAAIITIGEAHLERMGNRETIVRAKSEIVEGAETAVLNVDVPELAALADTLTGKTVVRCSQTTAEGNDVAVIAAGDQWQVYVDGDHVGDVAAPSTGHPINLAIAVGIAVAVGVPADAILRATKGGLPGSSHRAEVQRVANGTVVIDDTYNANPDGAAAAVRSAVALAGASGTVWTITPGMIELGVNQRMRNEVFAAEATAAPNMRLVITGHVNRRALLAGATDPGRVLQAADRAAAQKLIDGDVSPGDVLLFENDLPSHYP